MIVAVMTTALSGTAWAETVDDVLDREWTGVEVGAVELKSIGQGRLQLLPQYMLEIVQVHIILFNLVQIIAIVE